MLLKILVILHTLGATVWTGGHLVLAVFVRTAGSLGRKPNPSGWGRHAMAIREYLKIKPYGAEARRLIVSSIADGAITKHDLADLINVLDFGQKKGYLRNIYANY
jgi:hypothetical protein